MAKLKNHSGFSVVEALLIVLVVGILGFTGWFVYHSQQAASKDSNSQSKVQTTTQKAAPPVDPYADWEQYCSDYGGVCFKYPQDWQLSSVETADPNIKGAQLTSPSGGIKVLYTPYVDGIGGACESNLCFFQAASITKPAADNAGTLKVVKGVYTNKGSQVIAPYYYVSDDGRIAGSNLSVGKNVDVGFFAPDFSNPAKDGTEFFEVRDVEQSGNGYDSVDDANVWFSKDEVITAGKILSSVELK